MVGATWEYRDQANSLFLQKLKSDHTYKITISILFENKMTIIDSDAVIQK